MNMVETGNCLLVIVDVQGKLARLMYEKERLFKNIQILIKAAKILDIPILWAQQVPEALGQTVAEVAELLGDIEPINKSSFSCCGEPDFDNKLAVLGRKQVILCGIETHVCIYQTAAGLLGRGCEVDVIGDAVSSRTLENKNVGLERIAAGGGNISSTEMVLFELLRTAEHPKFREIARLVK